jgi:hypothetical protein
VAHSRPSKGTQHPQVLYLSTDREVFFMPLRVGWHLVIQVFSSRITWESCLKPPGPYLIRGIIPCLVLWSGTFLGWLSPVNGDPGYTQILIRHRDAKSQIVSQLGNLGTMPTSKSSLFSPFRRNYGASLSHQCKSIQYI